MFEKLVEAILVEYVSKWVNGLDSEKMKVALFGGKVEFHDNGMDVIAKKTNRLRVKLRPRASSVSGEDESGDEQQEEEELDPATTKKYTKRLQHWLAVACRLLQEQRQQVQERFCTLLSQS